MVGMCVNRISMVEGMRPRSVGRRVISKGKVMGEAKRKRTRIVQPEDWQPLPKIALEMIVIFGEATIRGGIPPEEVDRLKQYAANKVTEKDRQNLKDGVVAGLKENKHLGEKAGNDMLTAAFILALTSDAGKQLAQITDKAGVAVTYEITQRGSSDYNWRLIIENPSSPGTLQVDPTRPVFDGPGRRYLH